MKNSRALARRILTVLKELYPEDRARKLSLDYLSLGFSAHERLVAQYGNWVTKNPGSLLITKISGGEAEATTAPLPHTVAKADTLVVTTDHKLQFTMKAFRGIAPKGSDKAVALVVNYYCIGGKLHRAERVLFMPFGEHKYVYDNK